VSYRNDPDLQFHESMNSEDIDGRCRSDRLQFASMKEFEDFMASDVPLVF
jgi:hypothetical protein